MHRILDRKIALYKYMSNRIVSYIILFACVVLLAGCEWRLKPNDWDADKDPIEVGRYDRVESQYLTTGDFAALQQMNLSYPMETRTLVEDIIKIGRVNEPDINTKFLNFYQDTTLQAIIREVEQQYADMDDINTQLVKSFTKLQQQLPGINIPKFYAQIGSLDQSIIVGNNTLGICLDKYLGKNYPIYLKYYSEQQRELMTRKMIVPDCLVFYTLSICPIPHEIQDQIGRDIHLGKITWLTNKLIGKRVFTTKYTNMVDQYMKSHKKTTVKQLLYGVNIQEIINN